jgi:glucose/arabinose dehydrogenase
MVSHHNAKWALMALVLGLGLALSGCADQGLPVAADSPVPAGQPEIALALHMAGFNQPLNIAHAGDGSGRLFVVERGGRIRIIKDGAVLPAPFLDVSVKVRTAGGEQGLLGLAFSPDYASNGRFYVNYTDLQGHSVIARYSVSSNPDAADASSETVLLTLEQPYANHNGGHIAFGPNDGYLYIGFGDGGSANDPLGSGQNTDTLLGKILRIDVESGVQPYAIPATNPYAQTAGYRPEIWALGLRNPWRFAFDRDTGDLYIADVGQALWEEVNFQPASSPGGENYGWNIMEGAHCFQSVTCDTTGLTLPVVEYDHSLGCSITGGVVYRGAAYPALRGAYLYADYCSGRIWSLKRDGVAWEASLLLDTPYRITAFGEDEDGNVYLTHYTSGEIYRITDTSRVYVYLPVFGIARQGELLWNCSPSASSAKR